MDTQRSGGRGRIGGVVRAAMLGALGVALLVGAGVRPPGDSAKPRDPAARPLVVASHALDAGALLGPSDLGVAMVPPSSPTTDTLSNPRDAAGRRLLVGLPAGTVLLSSVLAPPLPLIGRRRLRVAVDPSRLDPAITSGTDVDVLAAVEAGGRETALSRGRVTLVAAAHVAAIIQPVRNDHAAAVGTSPAGTDAAPHADGPVVIVTLEADGPSLMRLLWAESFARTIRLVARDRGSNQLPAADATDPSMVTALP